MNLSVREIPDGGLLLVPQFTLAADTQKGTRAGFSTAAPPELARSLFDYLAAKARARKRLSPRAFSAANMQVSLINDGPVTFWLETPPARTRDRPPVAPNFPRPGLFCPMIEFILHA